MQYQQRYFNSVCFLLIGSVLFLCRCTTTSSPSSETVAEELFMHSNAFLDTISKDSNKLKIQQTVVDFLQTKNETARKNPYWLSADFERYRYPYLDIYQIEEDGHYQPTLLDIVTIEEERCYTVKIAFLAGRNIHSIYNFLATKQRGGHFLFSRILDHNTDAWERQKVGSINYIISPQHQFRQEEGIRLDSFNKEIASFFGINPIALTYYLCLDPQELFSIRGFDYHPMMYKFDTGGQNESWDNRIYAGNNSAWYPHEVIHSYTYALYEKSIHRVFDEGLATYLGGSNERSLDRHLQNLRNYLVVNPSVRAYDLLYNNVEINNRATNCLYAIGGLFCKVVLEEKGKKSLFQLLKGGKKKKDFQNSLKLFFGIHSNEDLDQFVREKLAIES